MANVDPGIRQQIIENIYQEKRSLIQKAAEALGPSPDAHQLTAQEEELAWEYPDPQQASMRETVWQEELQAAAQKYPDLDITDLIEEARPHVGARLFPFRSRLIGSGGRVDVREQADYADNVLKRVKRKRGEDVPDEREDDDDALY